MTKKQLLSGNEAIARGAYEAGVTLAAGYPGTPSTEILENLVKYKEQVYCEWAPNEKVAFEVAVGASLCNARVITTMKHVGLNVAADGLMNLSYIGVEGGFVCVVADDPGQHSSQNEQDTRQYARLAKVPILEPADSQECIDFMDLAIDISERHRTPVILKTTTRLSHSHSMVEFSDRQENPAEIAFEKNPPRHVPIPVWGREMRKTVEKRMTDLSIEASNSTANRTEYRDGKNGKLGIITHAVNYQYVRDIWPEASILKLGWSFPFPDQLIEEFGSKVDTVLVVEEVDPFLEEHVKSLGIKCHGKNVIPTCGELNPSNLQISKNQLDAILAETEYKPAEVINNVAADLPARPPVLCPGCPHRGIFYALTKHDVIVTGDIGCYSLGVFKPLERQDTILCMGAGISMAHGMIKAGEKRKVVGMVGDSTFYHSGITGLLDIAYNNSDATIIVVDNSTTAMTGHQEHPGTGTTLMGEATRQASIPAMGKACGMERVITINPYNQKETKQVLKEELESGKPSMIISKAPCPLKVRKPVGPQQAIDPETCTNCRKCTKLGCPAIEAGDDAPTISPLLCAGCGLCFQVCPFKAISAVK